MNCFFWEAWVENPKEGVVEIIKDPVNISPLIVIKDIFPGFKAQFGVKVLDIIVVEVTYTSSYSVIGLSHWIVKLN